MIIIQPSSKHTHTESRPKAHHRHHTGMDSMDVSTRYHVDKQYAFVPPQEPLRRLPSAWELWETTLDAAAGGKLMHGEHIDKLAAEQKAVELKKSALWREGVEKMPILPTDDLTGHEMELRRAHHVLAYIGQFYAHTLSMSSPICIPRPVTIPLLRVSKTLQIAPFLTYWDHALNNYALIDPTLGLVGDNLVSQTTFTDTADENLLYVVDLRLELVGAVALEQLRLVTEAITTARSSSSSEPDETLIANRLQRAATSIDAAAQALKTTHKLVNPDVFYITVAPWLRGPNLDPVRRVWRWEGAEEIAGSEEMLRHVGSPNAGQSPLFPAIDAYMGIGEDKPKSAFIERMVPYMLRGHREFIQHLRSDGCPIRAYVESKRGVASESTAVAAYNDVLEALKRFRTAHLAIVTSYVIMPARRAEGFKKNTGYEDVATPTSSPAPAADGGGEGKSIGEAMSGLMGFLKGFRDGTERAAVR